MHRQRIAKTQAPLVLRCFGALDVQRGGNPLEGFATHKTRALFVYLALRPRQPFTRAHLQTLLWDDRPTALAARSLRQALVNLRRIFPTELAITRATVTFNPPADFFCDVAQFETDATAVDLYRGEFLQGLDLPHAQTWEAWLRTRREELQVRALNTLDALGAQHAQRGEFARALQYYQRALVLEPWRESTHQAVMRTCALAGDRATALAQYDKCCLALADGLGVDPSPETEALYQHILNDTFTVEPLKPRALPFVGRGDAYAQGMRLWSEALRAGARLTLVEGEAGIGKTRLVNEILQQLELRGAFVARGQCVEFSAPVPYRPIVQALRQLLEQNESAQRALVDLAPVWRSELARLLPELRPPVETSPSTALRSAQDATSLPDGDRQHLFDAVTWFLIATGARAKTTRRHSSIVFFLDDIHWADAATLDLLHHLVRALTQEFSARVPFWFVGATRPEETPLTHPLTRLYHALARDDGAARLRLAPLAADAIAEIARAISDDETLAPFLQRESGGNPFILSEVVKGLQESGKLQLLASGKWQTVGALTSVLPEHVEDITLQRIGRLGDAARLAIRFAAVIGEAFAPDTLADVMGARAVTPVIFAEWAERRLLTQNDAGQCDFTHDKIREAVYHNLDPAWLPLAHERVGQGLLDRVTRLGQDPASIAAQIAYHFERGLDARRAAPFLAQAAESARQIHANAEAIDLYQRLLPHLRESEQVEPLLKLGYLEHWSQSEEKAEASYRRALALAQSTGNLKLEARAWTALAGMQIYDARAMAESIAQAEAIARSLDDKPQLVEILCAKGARISRVGDAQAALQIGEEALALSAELSPREIVLSLRLVCAACMCLGKFDKAARGAARALELTGATQDRESESTWLNTLGEIARLRGDFRAAVNFYEDTLAITRALQFGGWEYARRSNLAGARVGLGEYAAAETELRELVALPEARDSPVQSETHRFLAQALLGQGRMAEALEAAQRALEIARRVAQSDLLVGAWRVLGQTLGNWQAENGDWRSALAHLDPPVADAAECFVQSLRLCDETSMASERAWTLRAWSAYEKQRGDAVRGAEFEQQARAEFARLEMLWRSPDSPDCGAAQTASPTSSASRVNAA